MTTILSAEPTFLPHTQMPECPDEAWRSQYFPQYSLSASNWGNHGSPISGMHEMDLSIFQTDDRDFEDSCYGHASHLLSSSHPGYFPEVVHCTDMDVGTPSTVSFSNEATDSFRIIRPHNGNKLSLHVQHDQASGSAYSPQSSISAMSPLHPYPPHSPDLSYRPDTTFSARSVNSSDRLEVTSAPRPSSIKRSATSADEEEDDESVAGEEPKSRGRKRQRIPHTAVERRYRENLNAHLNRLRQTVPWLSSERPAGDTRRGGENLKPSKCEILNGAIEHIGALDKENASLQAETKMLRARLDDLEAYYRASGQRLVYSA